MHRVTLLISPSDLERLQRIRARLRRLGRARSLQDTLYDVLEAGLRELEKETR